MVFEPGGLAHSKWRMKYWKERQGGGIQMTIEFGIFGLVFDLVCIWVRIKN